MGALSRLAFGFALAAGAAAVFRKDLLRVFAALRAPTQRFLGEVRDAAEAEAARARGAKDGAPPAAAAAAPPAQQPPAAGGDGKLR